MSEPDGAFAAQLPSPRSERRAWALACGIGLAGVAIFTAILIGAIGSSTEATRAPPAAPVVGTVRLTDGTPAARAAAAAEIHAAIVSSPSLVQQRDDQARFRASAERGVVVARRWVAGFYPIYEAAQRTFGVNWLLLASIHMQESAFSTAPGTYRGLNFAHCCGGPMQFNVTNGPVTTWDLVADSYIYARRPTTYDHMTATHPSIYDDFDAIMAAAHLLSADGATYALDDTAWGAAYDYYGHDETGVTYADQVLARAISWSQHGFCVSCAPSAALVADVDAAYGAPVRAVLQQSAAQPSTGSRAERRTAGRGVRPAA